MHLVNLLRVLHDFKGQEGYRYCLAWLAVVLYLGINALVTVLFLWLAVSYGLGSGVTRALLSVLP